MIINLENNIEIKNNNQLIENDFLDLSEFFNILNRRKKLILLASSILFVTSIINLTYKRIANPQFLGTFSIMTRDPILDKRRDNSSGTGFIEDLAVNNTYSDIPTLIQYLKSEKVLSKTASRNNISTVSLRKRINISVPSNPDVQGFLTSILRINVTGPDKLKLSKITNDLSQDYIKIASETKKEKLTVGIEFLNNERPILEKRAIKLQDELEKFRIENKLINPIKESESLVSRIEEIKSRILILNSENVRLLFIKDNLLNGILYTEGINNRSENAGLDIIGAEQLLLEEILDVKSALAKAQSTYKKTSTVVLNLEAKLRQLEPILLENQKSAIDAAIIVNKGKIKSSQNELSELEKEFSLIPKLINKYSKIISNQKLIEQNLEYLLSAREKLELELSQGTLPWQIISKPYINPRPFKPEIKNNLFYGFLLSTFIALILALIIDKIDNVFHSIEDIKKDDKFPPLLGTIPFFKFSSSDKEKNKKNYLTINNFIDMSEDDKSLNFIFQETFRNIYTSIKFSTTDRDIKTVAITSSIPSEGKTLLSTLFGLNVSEIDKKILIIDADLRRPSLHKKLNVDNVVGLSNVLVEEECNWKENITKLKGFNNFYFMTGGKTPPNPIKLLDSNRMANLIKDIRNSNEFDLIIFDCPPILGLSDSLIISEFVDGVIVTISLNKVDKNLAKESLQKLYSPSTEILGVVTNSVKEQNNLSTSKGNYYYQYKYGYQKSYFSVEEKYGPSGINAPKEELDNDENNKNFIVKVKSKFIQLKNNFLNWINE